MQTLLLVPCLLHFLDESPERDVFFGGAIQVAFLVFLSRSAPARFVPAGFLRHTIH